MSDFDDSDRDIFFWTSEETPNANNPLGLVVGPTARAIFNDLRELVYDELVEIERDYRENGCAPVIFDEATPQDDEAR